MLLFFVFFNWLRRGLGVKINPKIARRKAGLFGDWRKVHLLHEFFAVVFDTYSVTVEIIVCIGTLADVKVGVKRPVGLYTARRAQTVVTSGIGVDN